MTPEELERIGDLLIEEGIVTYEEAAAAVQEAAGTALGSALASCRFPRRADLAAWLATDFKTPAIDDLRKITLTPALASVIPAELARKHQAVPLAKAGGILCVARPGLHSRSAIQDLRAAAGGAKVKVFVADEAQVLAAIEWIYGDQSAVIPEPARKAAPEPAPAAPESAEALPLISMPTGNGSDDAPAATKPIRIAWPEYEAAERDPGIQLLRVWDLLFVSGKPVSPIRPG